MYLLQSNDNDDENSRCNFKAFLGEKSTDWLNLQEAIRKSCEQPIVLKVRQQFREKGHWKDIIIERTMKPVWRVLLNNDKKLLEMNLGTDTEDWWNFQEFVSLCCKPIVLRVEQQVYWIISHG